MTRGSSNNDRIFGRTFLLKMNAFLTLKILRFTVVVSTTREQVLIVDHKYSHGTIEKQYENNNGHGPWLIDQTKNTHDLNIWIILTFIKVKQIGMN